MDVPPGEANAAETVFKWFNTFTLVYFINTGIPYFNSGKSDLYINMKKFRITS